MSSCVAINSEKQIVLSVSNTQSTIKISRLEERIKDQTILCFPVLSTESSVSKLHILWCSDMSIGKSKRFIIPCIKCILKSRPKIAEFHLVRWTINESVNGIVNFGIIKKHWYWDWKIGFRNPSTFSKCLPCFQIWMKGIIIFFSLWGWRNP